jgi:hypothetical protein
MRECRINLRIIEDEEDDKLWIGRCCESETGLGQFGGQQQSDASGMGDWHQRLCVVGGRSGERCLCTQLATLCTMEDGRVSNDDRVPLPL